MMTTLTTSNVREYFFEIEPVPASRPRVTKWGTFYGKRYEKFRREMREVLRAYPEAPLDGPLFIELAFFIPPPKTTKRGWPRGDIDNYIKGPLDSMTKHGGFYSDDDQIVFVTATKHFTKDDENNGIRCKYGRCTTYPPAV